MSTFQWHISDYCEIAFTFAFGQCEQTLNSFIRCTNRSSTTFNKTKRNLDTINIYWFLIPFDVIIVVISHVVSLNHSHMCMWRHLEEDCGETQQRHHPRQNNVPLPRRQGHVDAWIFTSIQATLSKTTWICKSLAWILELCFQQLARKNVSWIRNKYDIWWVNWEVILGLVVEVTSPGCCIPPSSRWFYRHPGASSPWWWWLYTRVLAEVEWELTLTRRLVQFLAHGFGARVVR